MRLVAGLILLAACSQGPGGHGARPPADAQVGTRCAAVRERSRALYRAAEPPTTTSAADVALADELAAANATMVFNDCVAEPARVLGCAETAATVAALERDCLIPLDEEGAVEGRALSRGQ